MSCPADPVGDSLGTTICGLADGADWVVRTIIDKFRDESEARVKPVLVPLGVG